MAIRAPDGANNMHAFSLSLYQLLPGAKMSWIRFQIKVFLCFSTTLFTTVIRSLGQLSVNILVYIPLSSGCKEVVLQMSTR